MAKAVPFAAGEGGGIPIAEYPLLAWGRPHDPGPRFGRSHDWQRPERSCCRQALMSVGGRRVGPLEGGVGEHVVTVLVVGKKDDDIWWREDACRCPRLAKVHKKCNGPYSFCIPASSLRWLTPVPPSAVLTLAPWCLVLMTLSPSEEAERRRRLVTLVS